MIAEARRLEVLHALDVLDRDAPKMMEDLVDLLAEICQVPIVAISLVDESRQFFWSSRGLSAREIPRDIGFCNHAIRQVEPFVVPDALRDPRFRENPLVTGAPGVRFYFGQPLVIENGQCVGTLCVIDRAPRQLTDLQALAVKTMANLVVFHLSARKAAEDRRKFELELNQQTLAIASTAKLTALGEMAAGIAHEINNPLTAIISRAGFLIEAAEQGQLKPEGVLQSAKAIEATSLRISKTVAALRSFARDGESEPMVKVKVQDLFADVLELCRERLKHSSVRFEMSQVPETHAVVCRPVEIVQVLLNLLNNAYDATIEGNDKWIQLESRQVGGEIEIAVGNGGPVLSPAKLEMILRPFYTTKPVGKGTGLGLSISQRILNSHHSGLKLDPQSDFTRFYFRLPLAEAVTARVS